MTVQEYLVCLNKEKPLFMTMYCDDPELRPIYVNMFVKTHGGVIVNRDSLELGKQPRMIGKKPVYIVTDWEPGRKNPKPSYSHTHVPVLLLYTSGKPTAAQLEAYNNKVVEIPPVTGAQVTTMLTKAGLDEGLIEYIKSKTDTTREALLIGKQVAELAKDLGMAINDCFNTYFANSLKNRNIDEEPTEFLDSLLTGRANVCFEYLASQVGNEFFVFASILNWLEDIIKFCSCEGDYWNNARLVAARYKPFRDANLQRIPFSNWVRLYEDGLRIMQSIKINQPDPNACLEVFVCHIIRILM